jgi:glucose/mannose-6-phosphate isomerase
LSVLDDLKMIHHRDAQDALGVISKQFEQLKYKFDTDVSKIEFPKVQNVIVGGMGGSALAAGIFQSWPGLKLPFDVVKNYDLPNHADEKTLFIASSYSGNTEETLSAIAQAQDKNCQIIVISAGGKLAEIAKMYGYPYYQLPGEKQPRMAVFYNFAALIDIFVQAGLVEQEKLEELNSTADWLGEQAKPLQPEIVADKNQAKQLAQEIVGNSVVIYSGPKLFPAAYKWKININENSKTIAWCNQIPEFNHNEFLGWTSHPVDKPYKVVDLKSSFDNDRIQKRFKISEKLLSGKRPFPETVEAEGDSFLKQILWTIQLGDFVSIYLALLNGINPTPVDLIEKLKKELND